MREVYSLRLEDIELLRTIMRVLTDFFPSSHRTSKDEFTKYKLYYFCLLTQQRPHTVTVFEFAAAIANLLEKYDPAASEELEDSQ